MTYFRKGNLFTAVLTAESSGRRFVFSIVALPHEVSEKKLFYYNFDKELCEPTYMNTMLLV